MRRIDGSYILSLVGLIVSLIANEPGRAVTPAPDLHLQPTIESAFLSIPEKYILPSPELTHVSDRPKMIDICDRINGYVKFSGKGDAVWEGYGECALFRRPDQGPLIAVSVLTCGPACDQILQFLSFEDGNWKHATSEVFEPLSKARICELFRNNGGAKEFEDDPPILYELPRIGTSIDVIVQEQIVGKRIILGRFHLKNGRFIFSD